MTVTITPQNLIRSKQRKGMFYFSRKNCYSKHIKTVWNPLAKQDRIEQDFDGSFYLIRKASKSKDFSIDFDEGGRSRIKILQARIWRKIRERLLLGCSIRFCLAKWSNMWSSLIFTAIFGKEKSPETFCFKTFSVVEATGLEPTTFWSLTKRATKLRYASICYAILANSITYYTHTLLFSQAFFTAFLTFFEKF